MKHIVLPTDFSIRSLQPIHDIMRQHSAEAVKITLLHLVDPPLGIGDLLFRLNRTSERYPIPPAFLEACEVMVNRYESRISGMCPVIKYGSTRAFLENLLHGMKADAVYMLQGFKEVAPFRDSVQMMPMLKRCRFNIIETSTTRRTEPSASMATVSDLLLVGS